MNNLNFQLIELTEITDKESASISGGYPAAIFYVQAVKLIDTLRRLNQLILDEEKPPNPYVSDFAPSENISSNRRLSESGRYL